MRPFRLPKLNVLSRRERLLVAGGVMVVSVVLLDRFVLGPWWRHTRQIHREIRQLEHTIRNAQQLVGRQPQIAASLMAYRDYLQPADANALDMASMLRELEALGLESGLSLKEVRPQEGAADEPYQEYAVEVKGQGSLQQWVQFIYLAQTSTSLFDIQRATINRSEGDTALLEGTLRLTSRAARLQGT